MIFLERGNRTDFVGRLDADGDGSRRDQVCEGKHGGKEFRKRWLEAIRGSVNFLESMRVTLVKTPAFLVLEDPESELTIF